jgi:hypothetical protein
MSDLLRINVNEHTEKKGQLTYLSWAWAWAEVLKIDPNAEWEAVEYPNPDGTKSPCMWIGDTAMVKTVVTILGKTKRCQLAVMDNRNNAVKNPDARKISDAIMRCMTKAISMHGLGLYIYAGEDLPEGEEAPEKPASPIADSFRSSPTMGAMDDVDPDRVVYLEMLASIVTNKAPTDIAGAYQQIEKEKFDAEEKTALWSLLDSKTRSALKKHGESLKPKQPEHA